jgi:hypothetical protein
VAAVTAAAPTLSQIQSWSTQHLETAASHWIQTAETWEDAFTRIHREAPYPGGTLWEGQAAEAAVLRTGTDRVVVVGAADSLHSAASAARCGVEEIAFARQAALEAVEEARAAGFTVGEDLSVTSRIGGPPAVLAARLAQAQLLAAQIRARAEALVAVDTEVGGKITTAISGVNAAQFGTTPVTPPQEKPHIQAVDNRTIKDAPAQPVPPDPQPGPLPPINDGDDVKRVLDPLPNGGKRGPNGVGTRPDIKEVPDSASVRRLWDYLTRNARDTQPPPGFDGPVRMLPDGTKIGLRQSTQGWDDTVQVWYPHGSSKKVHIPYAPPMISAPPQLPPAVGPAPAPVPPPQVPHPPVTLPPSSVFDPNGLPPWLENPSPPGFSTQPPTIMPGVPLPTVPPAPTPSPGGSSSFLPNLSHDLAEAGKAAGEGILAGIVTIGSLLAGGVTSSGQVSR